LNTRDDIWQAAELSCACTKVIVGTVPKQGSSIRLNGWVGQEHQWASRHRSTQRGKSSKWRIGRQMEKHDRPHSSADRRIEGCEPHIWQKCHELACQWIIVEQMWCEIEHVARDHLQAPLDLRIKPMV
jgi:hypothetical protein